VGGVSKAHFQTVEAYSDEALQGAANTFRRNPRASQEGTWEFSRLFAIESEIRRRSSKRRGKEAA